MKILIGILVLAFIVPAIGIEHWTNPYHDTWMDGKTPGSGKPIHAIDASFGQQNIMILSTINGVSTEDLATLRSQYTDNQLGNLGGVGMAPLVSNSFGPGGVPALRTSDPTMIAMGAQPIVEQSSLPLVLQGLV